MKSLIQKKSQQEIIVTVLLVLVALAAVGAIAYFITGQVQKNVGLAKNKAACLDVALTIEKVNTTSIIISRGGDTTVIDSIKLYIDGESNNQTITIPNALESKKSNVTGLAVGQKIRVNPVIAGYTCENGAEATVA